MAAEAPVATPAAPEVAYPWPVPEAESEWTELPWLCCKSGKDCGACCKAYWCPCLSMADAMEAFALKEGHPAWGPKSKQLHWFTGIAFGFFLGGGVLAGMLPGFFADPATAQMVMYVAQFIPLIFRGLFLWCLMWFRKEVTKQFNMKFMDGVGGICLDCCCPWYCHCWSMPQEFNTIEALKPKDDMIGQAVAAVTKVVKQAV